MVSVFLSYPKTRFLALWCGIEQQEVDESSYVLVLHDATETRKQTVEAIESERIHTLTLLAGSVAHEIGNPLNALHIHLQLIGREAAKVREMFSQQPTPPKRGRGRPPKAQAETPNPAAIDQSLRRLKNLFPYRGRNPSSGIDYYPVPAGHPPFGPGSKPINSMRSYWKPWTCWGPKSSIAASSSSRTSMSNCRIRLLIALRSNKLVNLIKMRCKPWTKMASDGSNSAGCRWSLVVEDNGSGISKERISRIFEPYFTTKRKGTGLGLMIVHRIIRDHGGRIMVEPNQPSGTIFRLWLPLVEEQDRLLGDVSDTQC